MSTPDTTAPGDDQDDPDRGPATTPGAPGPHPDPPADGDGDADAPAGDDAD